MIVSKIGEKSLAATTALIAEKSDRRIYLISLTFSYGLSGLIVTASPIEPLIDLATIGIVGGLLSAFLSLFDPVNRLAKLLMPKAFGTHDSVAWTLDAMQKMPTFMKEKVDLTPSTERIKQWAKNSYFSPYLSGIRAKIVAEVYFGVGLAITAFGSFPFIQVSFIGAYLKTLLLIATIAIIFSSINDFLELISRAHIVAVFEMMITFGIPFQNIEGLREMLKSGNWSEARAWMLRTLGLPRAPWHWKTIEPKYGRMVRKLVELEKSLGISYSDKNLIIDTQSKLEAFSNNMRLVAYDIAEKKGFEKDEKTLMELAVTFHEKNILSRTLFDGIEILEQIVHSDESHEALRLVGKQLLLIAPKMIIELKKIAKEEREKSD